MKKFYLLICILFLVPKLSLSQNERISSMGNPTIALRDFDLDLNLYDFGKNVAGLFEDRTFDVLNIRPIIKTTQGDYKRYFDYDKSFTYALSFDGTKVLKDGVFRGYVIYEIENRKNVNRALNRYPYSGIPFFIADTTVGDFIYSGPRVGFQYSFEITKSLYSGFELNYQLVDGLKSVYSRAKSLWRNIDGSLNLAYKFSNDFLIGGKISFLDNKESIEAKSEDLFDAEIFNYRGDNFAFKRRSQQIKQTYREKSLGYSIQSIITSFEKLRIGLKSEYSNSILKTLYPYGMLEEYEEGHSVFENLLISMKAHFSPLDNLLVGFESNYEDYKSWSRISELSLMNWKWELKEFNIGSGISYRFNLIPLILISEISLGKIISDSSKYIDNKFVNHNKPFYLFKTGLEYEILNQIFVRFGIQNGKFGFEPEKGGKDISINKISLGLGIYSFKFIHVDYYIDYGKIRNNLNQVNKNLNSQLNLKLFSY